MKLADEREHEKCAVHQGRIGKPHNEQNNQRRCQRDSGEPPDPRRLIQQSQSPILRQDQTLRFLNIVIGQNDSIHHHTPPPTHALMQSLAPAQPVRARGAACGSTHRLDLRSRSFNPDRPPRGSRLWHSCPRPRLVTWWRKAKVTVAWSPVVRLSLCERARKCSVEWRSRPTCPMCHRSRKTQHLATATRIGAGQRRRCKWTRWRLTGQRRKAVTIFPKETNP